MSLPLSAESLSYESGVQPSIDCLSIAASADPGVMPRVLELFAKRGIVPSVWHSRVAGPYRDELTIDVQVAGLSRDEARHIAACLRQIPLVGSVLAYERQAGAADR